MTLLIYAIRHTGQQQQSLEIALNLHMKPKFES